MKTLYCLSILSLLILLNSCSKDEASQPKSNNRHEQIDSNAQNVELTNNTTVIDSMEIIVSRLLQDDSLLASTPALIDSNNAKQINSTINSIDWTSSKTIGKRIKIGKEVCYLDRMPYDMLNTKGILYQLNWEAESAYETDGESLIFQLYITENTDSLTFNKMKRAAVRDFDKPAIIQNDAILWEGKLFRYTMLKYKNLIFWQWSNNLKDFCLFRGDNYSFFKSLYYHCLSNFQPKTTITKKGKP